MIRWSGRQPELITDIPKIEDVKVHSGFQDTFERTADDVLATVLQAVTDTGATKVLATGHSLGTNKRASLSGQVAYEVLILGGAIAAFDALMLKDALPNDVDVQFVSFGLPRVGNDEFANFIDASVSSVDTFWHFLLSDRPPFLFLHSWATLSYE